ncbi:MAG TPA: MarR family winged helix-turn-helix transcriptional regulator [Candidatus Solibacter sp.]|jgi:DNA-binding MarR family transcriptional regulator|nr:MarR family winged helix-turn-helix transcriptional regulator [Candidatus Solibacter sp.]
MSTAKSRSERSPSTAQLFRTAYNLLSQDVFDHVAASGFDDLRPAHGNVLERLTYGDDVRLSVMAATAGMTAQSMGELVDDLERRGYVERRQDPMDRRAKLVRLTAKGRKTTATAAQAVAAVEDRLRDALGPATYARVRAITARIIENARPESEVGPPDGTTAHPENVTPGRHLSGVGPPR